MWIALIVVAVLIVAVAPTVILVGRHRLPTVERVVVVLDTGRTIKGVLLRHGRDRVELGDVSVIVDGVAVPADGTMWLDRSRVEWIQVGV